MYGVRESSPKINILTVSKFHYILLGWQYTYFLAPGSLEELIKNKENWNPKLTRPFSKDKHDFYLFCCHTVHSLNQLWKLLIIEYVYIYIYIYAFDSWNIFLHVCIYIYIYEVGYVCTCIYIFIICTHMHTHIHTYTFIQGSLNKFPDFFRMGTFIDSTHMKL